MNVNHSLHTLAEDACASRQPSESFAYFNGRLPTFACPTAIAGFSKFMETIPRQRIANVDLCVHLMREGEGGRCAWTLTKQYTGRCEVGGLMPYEHAYFVWISSK